MTIMDVDQQQNDDIFGKIKQMIDAGCTCIYLTNLSVETPPESEESNYSARVLGISLP